MSQFESTIWKQNMTLLLALLGKLCFVHMILPSPTSYYFLTVRKIIRFDFAYELKIRGLRYICIMYNLNND